MTVLRSCKFEHCQNSTSNADQVCGTCASLRTRIRASMARGVPPGSDFGYRDMTRPVPAVRMSGPQDRGLRCMACDEGFRALKPIHEETLPTGVTICLHALCADIWAEENRPKFD